MSILEGASNLTSSKKIYNLSGIKYTIWTFSERVLSLTGRYYDVPCQYKAERDIEGQRPVDGVDLGFFVDRKAAKKAIIQDFKHCFVDSYSKPC